MPMDIVSFAESLCFLFLLLLLLSVSSTWSVACSHHFLRWVLARRPLEAVTFSSPTLDITIEGNWPLLTWWEISYANNRLAELRHHIHCSSLLRSSDMRGRERSSALCMRIFYTLFHLLSLSLTLFIYIRECTRPPLSVREEDKIIILCGSNRWYLQADFLLLILFQPCSLSLSLPFFTVFNSACTFNCCMCIPLSLSFSVSPTRSSHMWRGGVKVNALSGEKTICSSESPIIAVFFDLLSHSLLHCLFLSLTHATELLLL